MHAYCMVVALACIVSLQRAGADWQVWTLTETRRVLRDEPARTGTSVKIAAARNEWESFEILMRSDGPIKGVNIRADSDLPVGTFYLHRTDSTSAFGESLACVLHYT